MPRDVGVAVRVMHLYAEEVGLQVNVCSALCVWEWWKGAHHDKKMNYSLSKTPKPQTSTAKFAALGASQVVKSCRSIADENDFLADTVIIMK